MVKVNLFGTKSSRYEYVKYMINEVCEKVGVDISIDETDELDEIIKVGLKAIPALRINNHIQIVWDVNRPIEAFVSDAIFAILKEDNFGNLAKLIVPTDFSDSANNALEYAKHLTVKLSAVIRLVHIFNPVLLDLNGSTYLDMSLKDQQQKKLVEYVASMKQDWKDELKKLLFIDPIFKVGNEVDEILSSVQDEVTPYILMGMQGTGHTFKKIFGSISLKIAREANCPVFLIPEGSVFNGINRVIYAANDLELDQHCLPKLIKLAQLFEADVEVVHIHHRDTYNPKRDLAPLMPIHYSKLSFHEPYETEDSISNALNKLSDQAVDMIALATKRRGFTEKLFHKSMVKKFAIQTHTPLLILHGDS